MYSVAKIDTYISQSHRRDECIVSKKTSEKSMWQS